MNDHDLNKAMARLCGMGARTGPFDYRKPSLSFPYISDYYDHWELVRKDGPQEVWDPADNWQQVMDYVVLAVHRLPLQVQIILNPSKTTVVMNDGITPMFLKQAEGDCSRTRLVCELALEAREKMEAGNG